MYTANLDDCSQKQGNEDEPNRDENHSINWKKQWCAEKESKEILMLKKTTFNQRKRNGPT